MTSLFAIIACCAGTVWSGTCFMPQAYLSIDGGATRSFFTSDGLAKHFFEPASHVKRSTRPAGTVSLDFTIGNYLGISAGMGFRHFGQTTEPVTVFLKNDIFEHDFESGISLDYFVMPIVLKAGIHRSWYSAFIRFGITPSLLVEKEILWCIDGNAMEEGDTYLPPYSLSRWDAPLHLGGEAGIHFGKNALFIV
jgi:hypothetical protein